MKLRKEKGLSQEEFGDAIDVSRQAVSQWEVGETTPDTEKLRKIVEEFGVSYEYLLNDEIENEKDVDFVFDKKYQKRHRKSELKIAGIIVLIYLLICLYKFVAFTRFYLIANSFSEEKYSQTLISTVSQLSHHEQRFNSIRVGNQKLVISYSDMITDENGNIFPFEIDFTDFEKRICYRLNYDEKRKGYVYRDWKEDMISEEEVDSLFEDKNMIKEDTLGVIPSDFKEIFLASIDPRYYYVSIKNRQYKTWSFANDFQMKVQLNEDCLLETVNYKSEYDGSIRNSYSYDYVPEHFGDEIKDPIERGIYTTLEEEE